MSKFKNIIMVSVGVFVFSLVVTKLGTAALWGGTDSFEREFNRTKAIMEQLQASLTAAEHEHCLADQAFAKHGLADFYDGDLELTDSEVESFQQRADRDCQAPSSPKEEPKKVSKLFYVFPAGADVDISQSPREHFARNGYLATDISTHGKYLEMFAPSWDGIDKDGNYWEEEREYTVKIAHNYGTMGKTIELHWDEDGVPHSWAIGHSKDIWVGDGDVVRTGNKIGSSGGCPGDLQENEVSTGCHVHIELRVGGVVVPYPTYTASPHGDDLKALKEFKKKKTAEAATFDDQQVQNESTTSAIIPIEKLDEFIAAKSSPRIHGMGKVFYDAGVTRKVKPEVLVCIGQADTSGLKSPRKSTPNNIGNVGNTATASRNFDTIEESIYAIADTLNNQYLGGYTTIGQLSVGGGNTTGKIYASSPDNWNKNVLSCLSTIRGEQVDEGFEFRI